ncbi:hypothetical protein SAE02_73330 [Skermanella aerolata]|uniref:Uncharacterized protein n=1 Tax=Skermanella aerolata TaxID=393310 RepID=A0A512E399_9PROT|nr:hypothetical protein N826_36530 [Skermanella aerolata KACC 11604]GEO43185.1 hypothetical protein SAE02_73330 [Skermanella aerolata]
MFFSMKFSRLVQSKASDQGNPLLEWEEEDEVIVDPSRDLETLTVLEDWLLRPVSFLETE